MERTHLENPQVVRAVVELTFFSPALHKVTAFCGDAHDGRLLSFR